jgi:hypothetical protein
VIAFIVAVVLTAAGALVTAGWHVCSKHDPPKFEDLGVGFDILVGAMVMQIAFIPGSHGEEAPVRWAGVAAIFLILFTMAVITRYRGYENKQEYSGLGGDLTVYPMKPAAVKWTTGIGCGFLCAFWVLNEHIGWVLSALKELSH